MNDPVQVQAKVEAVIGAGLLATPLWAGWIGTVSMVASMVAAVCGALVGIHAVCRIWRRRKK